MSRNALILTRRALFAFLPISITAIVLSTYPAPNPHAYGMSVVQVQFSPDGRWIVSASFDKSVKLWDGVKGTFVASFRGHVRPVYKVSWSSDSRLIVSGSSDSTLKVCPTFSVQVDTPLLVLIYGCLMVICSRSGSSHSTFKIRPASALPVVLVLCLSSKSRLVIFGTSDNILKCISLAPLFDLLSGVNVLVIGIIRDTQLFLHLTNSMAGY